MANNRFSILCFSWNASGLRLCETMSQKLADENRRGFKAFITSKKACVPPDFFEDIRRFITDMNPDLILITTQQEQIKDTYFHSDFLPHTLAEINYTLIERDKLENINEPVPNFQGALRVSLFARNDIIKDLTSKIIRYETKLVCKQDEIRSGAVATCVNHRIYGTFIFIGVHLVSFNRVKIDYKSYRTVVQSTNNICLTKIMNHFINEKIDYIFMLGDFNYDIVVPNKNTTEIIEDMKSDLPSKLKEYYEKYDELRKATMSDDNPLYGFKEGVSSNGPLFLPTWELSRNRSSECEDETKINPTCFTIHSSYGGIGWHNRILYKETLEKPYVIHCKAYNRIDVKNMHLSTNAGILGFFELEPL